VPFYREHPGHESESTFLSAKCLICATTMKNFCRCCDLEQLEFDQMVILRPTLRMYGDAGGKPLREFFFWWSLYVASSGFSAGPNRV